MAKKSTASDKYAECLDLAMKAARYGPVRMAEAKAHYQRAVDGFLEQGMGLNDARDGAMTYIRDQLEKSALQKQDRVITTTKKLGEMRNRLTETMADMTGKWGDRSVGVRAYEALLGTVEDVERLKTARHNFQAEKDAALGNLTSMLRGVMDDFSKNWLGRNRGHVEAADIVNELYKPGTSKDPIARDIATALTKMWKYTLSELALHGVKIPYVLGDEAAFSPNGPKLERMGLENFKSRYRDKIDWTRSGNGYFIRPSEREAFLDSYFYAHTHEMWGENTWDTNAKLKGIPRPFEFTGGQFARDFQNFTMLKFKDGAAYADAHAQLMDGDFLSTVTRMVEKQAHNIALAKIWGPSPQYTAQAFKKMAEDAVSTLKQPMKPISNMNRLMRRFDNVLELAMKQNPMDGESRLGMFSQTTTNLMNSAMLNGALLSSVPGDFAKMLGNRLRNHEPLIGALGQYFKDFVNTREARKNAQAVGHIHSEYTSQITHSTHYNSGFAMGEHVTKWLADKTMKANLMNRHFDAMVTSDNRYRAISLFENRDTPFEHVRERFLLENNDISPAEWDRTRKAMTEHVYQPADGISMFRPLDHFDTLGSELVHKWQRLFWNESRRSVLRSSMEAQAIAMGGSRADTITGVLRKSTVAFQSYGITFGLNLGRAIMHGSPGERFTAFAQMGLTAVVAGAISVQARNLWQGRTLEPMDTLPFWLKAVSGGIFGPWGSVITGGLRTDPASSVVKAAGGPYLTLLAELYARTNGSAMQWMDMGDGVSKWSAGKEGVLWLDDLRRYAIPQTFYTTMLLQRSVLEPLQHLMAPKLMKNRVKGQIARAKGVNAPFWPGLEPGGNAFPKLFQ